MTKSRIAISKIAIIFFWVIFSQKICSKSLAQQQLQPSAASAMSAQILKQKTDKDVYAGIRTFIDALQIVRRGFRNVDIEEFVKDCLKAGISKIDPHSAFIPNFEQIMDPLLGNFSGIGVSILNKKIEDDSLLIIDVLDDSPAFKEGVLPGDRIMMVDEQKLAGMPCEEVISKMKGKRGSKVKLKINRAKKIIDLDITRDTINDQASICYHLPDQETYYIKLKTFSETAPKQMRNLLQRINNDEKAKGLILDLRANTGGIMESAVEIASLFVPRNSLIVSTRNRKNQIIHESKTTSQPVLQKNLCVFVLINSFTASAAEILAEALRHYSKEMSKDKNSKFKLDVFLLGNRTYGKGSVQEVIPLNSGSKKGASAIKMTTMLYFMPSGKSIQAIGVKPDFSIPIKKGLTKDERFIYEMFGQERSSYHHISSKEVESLINGKELEKSSEIDKETSKIIDKMEEERNKSDNDCAPTPETMFAEEDEEIGDIYDKIASEGSKDSKKNKSKDCKAGLEKKKIQSLLQDSYISTCISMISFLHLYGKEQPVTRKTAKKAIENNFCINKKEFKVEKIK